MCPRNSWVHFPNTGTGRTRSLLYFPVYSRIRKWGPGSRLVRGASRAAPGLGTGARAFARIRVWCLRSEPTSMAYSADSTCAGIGAGLPNAAARAASLEPVLWVAENSCKVLWNTPMFAGGVLRRGRETKGSFGVGLSQGRRDCGRGGVFPGVPHSSCAGEHSEDTAT